MENIIEELDTKIEAMINDKKAKKNFNIRKEKDFYEGYREGAIRARLCAFGAIEKMNKKNVD